MITARVVSGEGESWRIILPLLLAFQGLDDSGRVVATSVFDQNLAILLNQDLRAGACEVGGKSPRYGDHGRGSKDENEGRAKILGVLTFLFEFDRLEFGTIFVVLDVEQLLLQFVRFHP